MNSVSKPERPSRPVFDPDRIPAELRALPQWIPWCYAYSEAKNKWDKPPRRLDGGLGSSTNPKMRYPFEDVLRAIGRDKRFEGAGFVLTQQDDLTAVDLDHCIDRSTGAIADWAQRIVDDLDSYTERSPSREGIRIFIRAKLPEGSRRKGPLEMYDDGRYVTVTGDVIRARGIEARQEQIDAVHEREFRREAPAPVSQVQAQPVEIDDVDLIRRASVARNGAAFNALWHGDLSANNGDHSAADAALCAHLAFWTGRDPGRMDRLFRVSGLMRPKWDRKHRNDGATYGQMTIQHAISRCRDVYEGGAMRPRSTRASSDQTQRPPDRKPTLPAGDKVKSRRLTSTHAYHDESGILVYEQRIYTAELADGTLRIEHYPRAADRNGGWLVKTDPNDPRKALYTFEGVTRVPYRLPGLLQAGAQHGVVYFVEGQAAEVSVDRLIALGYAATCAPYAHKDDGGVPPHWQRFFTATKRVVLIPDASDHSRALAKKRGEALQAAGVPVSVFDIAPDRQDSYAIGDWIAERDGLAQDAVRAELRELSIRRYGVAVRQAPAPAAPSLAIA